MTTPRSLPERRNPLVAPKHTPQMNLLIERRRLGQTELSVKPGQIGTSNATKPDNLGMFDYAHLRVPLPKDLQGSGIFTIQRNHSYPESYFLMRRSSDGFISATGMFKAAFPWASTEQEEMEKKYIKSLPQTGEEEVAGNVWISPESALELADEYDMRAWIDALLDPSPIPKGTHDPSKRISTPPRFNTSRVAASPDPPSLLPPVEAMSTRKRSLRSASPTKSMPLAPAPRKIATPKRARRTRPAAGTSTTSSILATSMESARESSQPAEDSVEPESINGDAIAITTPGGIINPADSGIGEVVKIDVKTTTEEAVDGQEPLTTTRLTIETPPSHPQLDFPTDPQAYLDQAKAAIAEANRLTAGRAAGKKRKALEMLEDDSDDSAAAASTNDAAAAAATTSSRPAEDQPNKRLRRTETELRKEKIKRRATLGIAASLAVGAMLPVVMSTFFSAL
ncbi:hypothetical protein AAFC00_006943 [Neodothiora populina]|uniref:HTH APSES-type domain-containing protein n=1 Tax=Neodothiora populina TaxID=2781224 RepID=A0ABR3PCZ3_9PEZI